MTVSARLLATALLAGAMISTQVAPLSAADRVGVASAVNQSAQSQVGGGAMKTVRIGKSVFNRERIATGPTGLVQVLLADGSNFVVGPNSSLVIDEFVYRPADGQAKLVATFGRGVARYVGGRISKNRGGVTINTRQGTIGVRGGMANLLDQGGQTVFSFLFGKDLTFTGAQWQGDPGLPAGLLDRCQRRQRDVSAHTPVGAECRQPPVGRQPPDRQPAERWPAAQVLAGQFRCRHGAACTDAAAGAGAAGPAARAPGPRACQLGGAARDEAVLHLLLLIVPRPQTNG